MKMTTIPGTGARRFLALNSSKLKNELLIIGCLLGIALFAISIALDIIKNDAEFTVSAICNVYNANPVHWVILTSPFFLGSLFYFMGMMISQRELALEQRTAYDHAQLSILQSFIADMGNGNYSNDMPDTFDNRLVAEQLNSFRKKLVSNKVADERRRWQSEGLTRLGDILRIQQDVEALANDVVQFLVKYCEGNQGALFLLKDEVGEQCLRLEACYAYERKKYVSATIPVGHGLVGQCFLERETVLLTDVPKDYVKITSGLGAATPRFLAIVPMKAKDAVNGVIEIASFERFEEYKIHFLEKAAEAFASIVEAASTGQNIRALLHDAQQQAEALRSQEEELRQNVEELQSIQEQLTRQLHENGQVKKDLELRERVLTLTTILSESDRFGTITYVNPKFCEVSQFRKEELIGKPHNIVRHPDMPAEIFHVLWKTIKSGRVFRGVIKNRKKDGTHYWVDAVIVPVMENDEIVRYIGARYYIQDEEQAQRLYQQQLRSLNLAGAREADHLEVYQ